MQPFKILSYFALIGIVLLSFSCEKEDEREIGGGEGQPTDRGDVEADGYWFIFENVSTQVKDTFKYGNFDTETAKYDTIRLDRPLSSGDENAYSASIQFFDGQQNVTNHIEANDFDYIVCYRDNNTGHLRLQGRNLDSNDNIIGLESDWEVVGGSNQNATGVVKITLNYQQQKENLCDGGVRIFEATVPYKLY